MKTGTLTAVGSLGLMVVAAAMTETRAPVLTRTTAPRVIRVGDMPVARAAHQATVLPTGQLLITGGCAEQGCDSILASAELYHPRTRSFHSVAPMAVPRAGHVAIALPDGRVLVAGGWTGQQVSASAEIYDPKTARFAPVGSMTEARESAIATHLPHGRVLIVGGGGGPIGLTPLASAEVFDPATSTFSAVSSMHTPRGSFVAVALKDGRVLVTGGRSTRRGGPLRSAEIFDPATGTFQPTGAMVTARAKHAGALLPDGKVLIIGGSDGRGPRGLLTSTEIYDPTTGHFALGPTMRWGRYKLRDAVVVLPSGAVLVAGGAVRPELLDPADRVFTPVAGVVGGPRMFATADLLPTGDVLILGGYDERIQPSASAWLMSPAH